MIKINVITATILLSFSTAFGQTIEIGQDAKSVKEWIEWATKQRTGYDSYGRSLGNNVSSDVEYSNGRITRVIQCFEEQYLIDFQIRTTYCKHYIMESEKLAYVLTQYEDVSTEKLTEIYDKLNSDTKIDGKYFSDDYKNYSRIYLANNEYATVEWRKANTDDLPESVREDIQKKQEEERLKEETKKRELEEKLKIEREIKSKTYDLKKYDSVQFELFQYELKKSLLNGLIGNSNAPSWTQLESSGFWTSNNTYNAHYKIKDEGIESIDYGTYIYAGNEDIVSENKFVLVSGSDTYCQLLKNYSKRLPTINYKGYNVMTEAKIDNITVSYVKGITTLKIRNGVVTYKKHEPPQEFQDQINEKLNGEINGLYQVKYEIGVVMDRQIVEVEKTKIQNPTGKLLKTVGFILLLAGGALLL